MPKTLALPGSPLIGRNRLPDCNPRSRGGARAALQYRVQSSVGSNGCMNRIVADTVAGIIV